MNVGMESLVTRKCTADGCDTCATFGIEADGVSLRCSKHRKAGGHLTLQRLASGLKVVDLSMSDK